jgi:hypothetical protein
MERYDVASTLAKPPVRQARSTMKWTRSYRDRLRAYIPFTRSNGRAAGDLAAARLGRRGLPIGSRFADEEYALAAQLETPARGRAAAADLLTGGPGAYGSSRSAIWLAFSAAP